MGQTSGLLKIPGAQIGENQVILELSEIKICAESTAWLFFQGVFKTLSGTCKVTNDV